VPDFLCRIGAPDGSVLEQRRLASSEEALRRELEGEGLHVFAVSRARGRIQIPLFGKREKVGSQEFLFFNTQLRTLLRAGLPLAQSLELLAQQQANLHFRELLGKVHQQVTTGIALSDAFLSLGDAFPRLYVSSLRAGERSGELEQVLKRFVEYQRLLEALKKKIVGALTYPAVLMLMASGLIILMVSYVIPKFQEFYVSFESELPLPTRIVLGFSGFVQNHFVLLTLSLIGGIWALRLWTKTSTGRYIVDRWKLKLPLLGKLGHLLALSQFSRSLAVLLGGGTPMVPALETAAASVNNTYLSELMLGCVPQVQEGRALSDAVEATGQAPELSIAMMRVGEATGALPEMLNHTSEFFDDEVDFSLNRIVTLFEPAILIVMGVVVAGLLLAVYYPLLVLVNKM
jgi:type IV pilus assembly protein PilC